MRRTRSGSWLLATSSSNRIFFLQLLRTPFPALGEALSKDRVLAYSFIKRTYALFAIREISSHTIDRSIGFRCKYSFFHHIECLQMTGSFCFLEDIGDKAYNTLHTASVAQRTRAHTMKIDAVCQNLQRNKKEKNIRCC